MSKGINVKLSLVAAASALVICATARDFSAEERAHWAFQPVKRSPVPSVSENGNPIDAFILKELEARQLKLNAPADKVTLIRRASLDLIGLPPSPEEVGAFLADDSPQAFERVIDRLLLSPHYGEKAARHWLDLARYAESEGFKADETRPNAWRYRDYVIKSFNADKPYDRFVMEQIAGDELWPENAEALIATGFNRHYPDESNARNLMQRRQEILNDITDTVGAVFTGLTFACARCHDHKFDPILQADYYRLQAFFANTAAADSIPLLPSQELEEYQRKLAAWEETTKEIREKIAALEAPKRREILDEYIEKYPAEIRAALAKPAEERNAFECQMVAKAELYIKPTSHQYIASSKAVAGRLKAADKEQWEDLNKELKTYEHLHPGVLPVATAVMDISDEAPKTHLLSRGNWDGAKEEIKPGFLAILNKAEVEPVKLTDRKTTGRRAALAKLLTSPENPLTARVMINRVWQQHFGRGLVETGSDFGMKGGRPSHPELLDWLASEFVNTGWSVKQMHKRIMLSAAYQQASAYNETFAKVDPQNSYLWRYPRHRLQGENIRDAALKVSGMINLSVGGPSVFPELPSGLGGYGGWKTSANAEDRNRRSIYVFVRRNMRYPMFESFDMPDTHESCSRRNTTTSPLQALTMLNNKVTLEWAQSFADRVLEKAGSDEETQIQAAYELAFSRKPKPEECVIVKEFLARQKEIIAERETKSEPLALPAKNPDKLAKKDGAALVDLCHMLLNSNEFVYVN